MDVSLYHRLAGIGVGLGDRLSCVTVGQEIAQGMQAVRTQVLAQGERATVTIPWQKEPLANGLMLLPLMLYCHEDPLYLGDRLAAVHLPEDHLPWVCDLAMVLSAGLRERWTVTNFADWYAQQGVLRDVWRELWQGTATWRAFGARVQELTLTMPEQQLLRIVGAIAVGGGQWQRTITLVANQDPLIQLWVGVLLGSLRGDRQMPLEVLQRLDIDQIHAEVQQLWSRWAGLPCGNQLQLNQFPLIASGQVLQYRPALKLLSQHHLL